MATKKSTPKPKAAPGSRAASRPRAIIEGRAEDITPKVAKSAGPTAGDTRADQAKTDKAAPKALPKASPKDKGAGKPGSEKSDAAEPATAPPLSSATYSLPRGAGALALAGLAGGVATVILIALATAFDGPPRTWLAKATGAQNAARLAQEASALAQSTAANLKTSLTAQEAAQTAALGALNTSLADIRDRLAPIEDVPARIDRITTTLGALGELPAQATALGLRLEAAETRLDTLARNAAARAETVNSLARALDEAAKAGTSAEAVSAGLAVTTSRLDAVEAQLEKLAQDIGKATERSPVQDDWRRDADARLAALRQDLDTLAARLAADETDALAAKREAELDALGAAIAAGRPYADLLVVFESGPGLSTLAKYAATGVPDIESLKASLARLPEPARPGGGPDGTIGRIVGLFGGAIKVRRTGEPEAPQNPVAAAREALDAGDAARAAEIVSQAKQGPETEAWIADARARAEIDAAFAELETSFGLRTRRSGD